MITKYRFTRIWTKEATIWRILADAVVVFGATAGGWLVAMFSYIGTAGNGSSVEGAIVTFVDLVRLGLLLDVTVLLTLAVAGAYRTKKRVTHARRLTQVWTGVSGGYAAFLLASVVAEAEWIVASQAVLKISYVFALVGCLGSRVCKWYVLHHFYIEPRRRRVERPIERILVIGGAGYIGSILVRQLLDTNYEVRVLDKLLFGDSPIRDLYGRPRFDFMKGDLRDVHDVVQAVRGMDAVIHLGAIVGDPACSVDEETTLQTNYAATTLVAQVCRASGVSRMLFASTCSVYGASDHTVDETSPLNPISLYAATKVDSENALLVVKSDDFHPIILRLGTCFGWSYRPRFDLVVNLLTAQAFFEDEIVIYNQEQWRPFIHVRDVARAFVLALEAPLSKVSGEVFNIGSAAMNHRLGDVAEAIAGVSSNTRIARQFNNDQRDYRVSFEKSRSVLGFEYETTLVDGITEIYEALAAGLVKDSAAPCYHNHKLATEDGMASRQNPITLQLISDRFSKRSPSSARSSSGFGAGYSTAGRRAASAESLVKDKACAR